MILSCLAEESMTVRDTRYMVIVKQSKAKRRRGWDVHAIGSGGDF